MRECLFLFGMLLTLHKNVTLVLQLLERCIVSPPEMWCFLLNKLFHAYPI